MHSHSGTICHHAIQICPDFAPNFQVSQTETTSYTGNQSRTYKIGNLQPISTFKYKVPIDCAWGATTNPEYLLTGKNSMLSAAYAPLSTLPPEIVLHIMSYIPTESLLPVKLVSKIFHAYATIATLHNKTINRDLAQVCRCQTMVEASLPRGRPLNCCICTHCGRVKKTCAFTDTQSRKVNPKRICISCGILQKKYTEKRLPRVDGEYLIPCWECREAVPQFRCWRYILSIARHRFQLPPEPSPDAIYDMLYGAYCKECLEKKIGTSVEKLQTDYEVKTGIKKCGSVTWEGVSWKGVVMHGVALENGPGFFKL